MAIVRHQGDCEQLQVIGVATIAVVTNRSQIRALDIQCRNMIRAETEMTQVYRYSHNLRHVKVLARVHNK